MLYGTSTAQLCDFCTAQATFKVWKHYYCLEHYNEYIVGAYEAAADEFETENEYTNV